MVFNSLNASNLEAGQLLYLVRYSQRTHPDYLDVSFLSVNIDQDHINYTTDKGLIKKIPLGKIRHKLFVDKNEMSKYLYDCFLKRNKAIPPEYKELFLRSQDERPELWI